MKNVNVKCPVGLLFSLFAICAWQTAEAAPPSVSTLYPTGAQRGGSVEVTATGTLDPWPLKVWTDRPGVTFEPAEKKGQFQVTVAPDAPAGVHWVRFYNAEGGSSLRPFVVGVLPEVQEKEPNDSPSQPQELESANVVVNGRFEKAGDVDTYAVHLQAGQTLVAHLDGNHTFGSPMDAILQIADERGFVLAHNDDARGLDPRIIFEAPSDGRYLVRGFSFPSAPNSTIRFAGGADYIYRLTITTGGFAHHAFPTAVDPKQPEPVEVFGWNIPEEARKLPVGDLLETLRGNEIELFHPELGNTVTLPVQSLPNVLEVEPNDNPDQAQEVPVPVVVSGRIGIERDVDVFRFRAEKNQSLDIRIEARQLGFPLDPHLTLTDSAGKVLREMDDASRADRDAAFTFKFPAEGEYRLAVRDLHRHGGLEYAYRLTIAPPRPDFTLTLAADHFETPADKTLEIPVTVNRENGFAGDIEISAADLPEGVTAETVVSNSKGDSAKAVKLVLKGGDEPISANIRIVGVSKQSDEELSRTATASVNGLTQRTPNVWLTVVK
jgi:hypothetical protein